MTSYTRVFNSLLNLINMNNKSLKTSTAIYSDKVLLRKTIYNNKNDYNILCWKSKCLYNMYFNDFSYENKIFSLDFKIKNNFIKIKHLSINNDFYDKYHNYNYNNIRLSEDETLMIKKFIFNDYIISYANNKNINKIIIDINSNLERYNYELKDEGFIPNYDNKCNKNPYWIQAEKNI
jgi:hypothetical protein